MLTSGTHVEAMIKRGT